MVDLRRYAALLALAAILIVWQAICSGFAVSEFIFPGPWSIVQALVEHWGPIRGHALKTLWTTLAGFGIGIAVGVALGALIGSSRLIYGALYPLLVGFNAIPKVAFVPVLVVWFGIGTIPAILMAFLICFFPIVVNVATGLSGVEPELEDVLRALGASRMDVLWKVGLPRTLPYLFAALKIAITLAFVGTVLSETVAGNDGIGYLMMSAGSQMRMPLVFAGLAVISIMAMLTYEVFAWLERRLTGWAMRGMEQIP